MGSLSKALVGSFLEERDGVHIYFGEVDKLWTSLGCVVFHEQSHFLIFNLLL